MKKLVYLSVIGLVFSFAPALRAQETVPVVTVSQAEMKSEKGNMEVMMNLDFTAAEVKSNRAMLVIPSIVNATDSVELPAIGVYGRKRYYYYVRNNESLLTGRQGTDYREKDMPEAVPYTATVPYAEWMDGAKLKLNCYLYGCCSDLIDEDQQWLAEWNKPEPFRPQVVFLRPEAETQKTRELSGTAYIDFYVNKTFIAPEYHNNTAELAKIQATIDSVRLDKDVTITELFIKGYASPESPYKHNTMLAKGRTEALKEYVNKLFHFPEGLIATDYEPENWEGLRRAVEQDRTLAHRDEILSLIDGDREPDNKEWVLKRDYPTEYRYLLKEVYPYLRRSDYRIAYTIRTYTDIEEIKRVLRTRPQNLSLNEFFLAALSMDEGSDEYNEVFETAVRMYPESETANLNAANAALQRNDLRTAARYLQKAGTSPQAEYARGIMAYFNQQYTEARTHLTRAAQGGVNEANQVLKEIEKL